MRFFIFTFLALITLLSQSRASDAPVVVELFTSQSCSSCPAADVILKELADKPDIIALGCHVTYWDHLQWKDTLSQKFCTERQRNYASSRSTQRVYTPQTVINGKVEFVGSRRSQIFDEIEKAQGALQPVGLSLKDPETLQITLPDSPNTVNQLLWLFGYQKYPKQDIRTGENRGKSLEYANAVVTIDFLGSWDGTGKTFDIPLPKNPGINGLALIVQQDSYGPIMAAGQISL